MKSLRDFKGTTLEWVQTAVLRRYHELRSGSEVLETLEWQRVFGSLALATTSEGVYSLKRSGFLHPHVTVRETGSEEDFAVLHLGFLGNGVLMFRDGWRYPLLKHSLWGYEWNFTDENGQPICTIKKRRTFAKHAANVRIETGVKMDRRMAVILAVGWYAMVLASEEAAAAGAASANS